MAGQKTSELIRPDIKTQKGPLTRENDRSRCFLLHCFYFFDGELIAHDKKRVLTLTVRTFLCVLNSGVCLLAVLTERDRGKRFDLEFGFLQKLGLLARVQPEIGQVIVRTKLPQALGALTPPYGMTTFITARILDMPMLRLAKAMLPWMLALFFFALIVAFFPRIVMWLPHLMGYV